MGIKGADGQLTIERFKSIANLKINKLYKQLIIITVQNQATRDVQRSNIFKP